MAPNRNNHAYNANSPRKDPKPCPEPRPSRRADNGTSVHSETAPIPRSSRNTNTSLNRSKANDHDPNRAASQHLRRQRWVASRDRSLRPAPNFRKVKVNYKNRSEEHTSELQ